MDIEVDCSWRLRTVEDGYAGDDWERTWMCEEMSKEATDGEKDCGIIFFYCFMFLDAEYALGTSQDVALRGGSTALTA